MCNSLLCDYSKSCINEFLYVRTFISPKTGGTITKQRKNITAPQLVRLLAPYFHSWSDFSLHTRRSTFRDCGTSSLEHFTTAPLRVFESNLKIHMFTSSFRSTLLYCTSDMACAYIYTKADLNTVLPCITYNYLLCIFSVFPCFSPVLARRL